MDDSKNQLDAMNEKLKNIESLLEKIIKDGVINIVNIEHFDVKGPLLNNLEFTFDKIDINEVSGALNLGNNLGVHVDRDKENKKVQPSEVKVNGMEQLKKQKDEKSSTTQNDQTGKSRKFAEIEKMVEEKLQSIFSNDQADNYKEEQSTTTYSTKLKRVQESCKSNLQSDENPIETNLIRNSNEKNKIVDQKNNSSTSYGISLLLTDDGELVRLP